MWCRRVKFDFSSCNNFSFVSEKMMFYLLLWPDGGLQILRYPWVSAAFTMEKKLEELRIGEVTKLKPLHSNTKVTEFIRRIQFIYAAGCIIRFHNSVIFYLCWVIWCLFPQCILGFIVYLSPYVFIYAIHKSFKSLLLSCPSFSLPDLGF